MVHMPYMDCMGFEVELEYLGLTLSRESQLHFLNDGFWSGCDDFSAPWNSWKKQTLKL